MSAVMQNEAMRSAQLSYDSRSPDEHDDAADERAEALRVAIKGDAKFVAEALANIDLTDLADAYLTGEAQATHDALADLVDDYLRERITFQLRRSDYVSHDHPRTDLEALENIARVWGVN